MNGVRFLGALSFIITAIIVINHRLSVDSSEDNEYPVWVDMMEQADVNMQEARIAFDTYWLNREHYQGDRHKQFERWYAINSKRTNDKGNLIHAKAVSSAYRSLIENTNGQLEGSWYCYGPVNVGPRNGMKRDGGRVKDIQFHPNDPQTMYVSCFKSGLFKTVDAGVSWEALCDNIPEQVFVSAIKPSDPNTIYIGTDLGVYITNNEGDTWNATAVVAEVKALTIQPGNENVIIVGAANGIYRSTDSGLNWSMVQSSSKVEDLKFHPTNSDIVYAATNGTNSQFYRSIDGGVTWTENTSFGQGCFMKIAVTPAAPDYVFVLNARDHMGNDSFEGFYQSTDAGLSFTKQSGTSPCIIGYKDDGAISRGQPNYNLFLVVDPNDESKVWAGGVKSWKSDDGGETWTQFFNGVTTDGGNLHLDQLNWAYSPHNCNLYAANDGGIYYLNTSNQFHMITDGLPIAEVYECTQSQTKKTNVAGGTMHCGVKLNNDGMWYTPWGGDEATCIIDPTNEQYVYHLKYEKVSRSSNGGFNFSRINSANTDRGEYTGTGVLHKGDVNTLFVGFKQLQRSNNVRASSVNWSTISSFAGTSKIQKVEQTGANEDVFYVARGTELYRSDNINAAAPSYTNLTANLPLSGVSVNDIETLTDNENVVFILQGSKIYRSSNKGASWTDLTSNLPTVALLEMTLDQTNNEGIYIGTDIGVFYKDASMTDWINFSEGLPAVRVSGMDIFYGDTREESLITISTDGRGFWRSPLYGVIVEAPVADFDANYANAVVGSSIQFTDVSTNNPQNLQWQFQGGLPASSVDVNPIVRYDTPGTYNVSLSVANSAGADTKTITGFVTVESDGGDLQVHYQFDGDLQDASLYHRDGSNAGVDFITDAERGDVANFNGNAQITVPGYSGEDGTNARTICAWIKTSTMGKSIVAWGKAATSTKWAFRLESTGVLRLEPGGGNIIGTTNVADDKWHHVACVFDDDGSPTVDDVTLYVDGIKEGTIPSSVAINTVAQGDVNIGNDQMGRKFIGQMADVRIYSNALSGSEIAQLAALSTNIVQPESEQWVKVNSQKGGQIRVELLGSNSAHMSIFSISGKLLRKKIITEGVSTVSVTNRQKVVIVQVDDSLKGKFTNKLFLE